MKKIKILEMIITTIFFLIVFNGCAHTFVKYNNEKDLNFYKEVEKLCEKEDLTIETISREEYKAKDLKITRDTTSFIDNKTNLTIHKKTKDISTISFHQKLRGAFEGFLYGTLAGGGLGLLSQLSFGGGSGSPKGDVYLILYSALTGAVLGTTYGVIHQSKTTIKIN